MRFPPCMKTSLRVYGLTAIGLALFATIVWGLPALSLGGKYFMKYWSLPAHDDRMEKIERSLITAKGPEAKALFHQLEPYRDDEDRYVRMNLAHFLGELSTNRDAEVTDQSIALSRKMLADKDHGVTVVSTAALGKFGPRATTAIPDLKAVVQSRRGDPAITIETLAAIEETQPAEAADGVKIAE